MLFQDLYRGYTGSHGTSVPTGRVSTDTGKAEHKHYTKKGAPTDSEWGAHLSGKGPGIGIIPLLDDSENVYWGAIDVDLYKGAINHADLEKDIANLPLTLTKSKSGGAHLWLFCSERTPARLVIAKLQEWAAALGFGNSEIFPKQHKRLMGTDDQGNWINLPYYGKTRRCVYQGEEVDVEKFLEVAETRLVDVSILDKIQVTQDNESSEEFSDGPPCLQTLFAQGIVEGGRNNTMFNVAIYYKKKYPDDWEKMTADFALRALPAPLPPAELRDSAKILQRKAYNYTCSKHPIASVCNRAVCVKREFGIANGSGSLEAELNVVLSGLTKINTSNPRWLVNIDGVRAEIPGTESLLEQKKFGTIVVERVHRIMTSVPAKKWNEQVQKLLDTVEIVEAPPEASIEGRFYGYITNFIEIKQNSNRDAMASGSVWICDKCNAAYFRANDLLTYLQREGMRELNSTRVFELLNNNGLRHGRFNIKGKTVTYWRVPLPSLQSEPFDVPKFTNFEGETSGNKSEQQNNDHSGRTTQPDFSAGGAF